MLHQYRGNTLTTAPTIEPVTLDELKAALNITDTADDTILTDFIEEARHEIEDTTGVAFVNQTWQLTMDNWPSSKSPWWDGVRQMAITELDNGKGEIRVPRWPLGSVTSVTVYDSGGISSAVTVADVFDIDTQQILGRIALQVGAVWPIATQAINAIEVVYVSGYGAAASDVPAPLKRAIRQMAAYMYEHRGDGCTSEDAYVKSGAASIMKRYKVVKI